MHMTVLRHEPALLVDAHVHCNDDNALQSVLSAGVGAVRNAGTSSASVQGPCLHSEQPVVISCCWALCKKGGYGERFGKAVETPAEIKAEVLKLKQAGADIIKVMASGMVSLKDPGKITTGGFNREELKIIVQEAAVHGLHVMAHANGEPAIIAAAQAGVRSIEHGFFMTPRALAVLADKEVFWIPTVSALIRASEAGGVTAEARAFVAGIVRHHLRMISDANAAGIRLAVGTDCVLPDQHYQTAYESELAFFEQAGLSREETLRCAREQGARLLGIAAADTGEFQQR